MIRSRVRLLSCHVPLGIHSSIFPDTWKWLLPDRDNTAQSVRERYLGLDANQWTFGTGICGGEKEACAGCAATSQKNKVGIPLPTRKTPFWRLQSLRSLQNLQRASQAIRVPETRSAAVQSKNDREEEVTGYVLQANGVHVKNVKSRPRETRPSD